MKQNITTAVIAVAGWGTRWLPLTKTIEKCMVPVGTRPIVDWVVSDCVRAGLTRIIFVVGEDHQQIRHYYSHHAPLEAYLTAKNKTDALVTVQQPQYDGVHFEFVTQPIGKYGTSVPIDLVASMMASDESFVYLYGDDMIFRPDGGSEVADMLAAWRANAAEAVIMTKKVTREQAPRYGVVMTDENGLFRYIHEKPALHELPDGSEPCINLGKYIVSPDIVRRNAAYMATSSINKDGEYYVTDIFGEAAQAGRQILVYNVKGEHLDAGTPDSWLKTNMRVMHSLER